MRSSNEPKDMELFFKVLNDILTEKQIEVLRFALKTGAKVYFYGHGLGKSLLTEVLTNAGFAADEPGTRLNALGPMEVHDEEGVVSFCVKNTPKDQIPNIYEILLELGKEIANWVNQ